MQAVKPIIGDQGGHSIWRHRHAARFVVAGGICLVAVIWAATIDRTLVERDQAIASTLEAHGNLAIGYEANAVAAFQSVEHVLRLLEHDYLAAGSGIQDAVSAWPVNEELIHGLAVVGSDGSVILATGGDAVEAAARRQVEVEFHRSHPGSDLHIGDGERVLASDGEFHVVMSRRLEGPDGRFLGLTMAVVNPVFFTRFYGRMSLGANGAASLLRRDGRLIARVDSGVKSFGGDTEDRALLEAVGAAPSGHYLSAPRWDGDRRVLSYRASADFPVVVTVETPLREAVGAVNERALVYYFAVALATAMIILAVATGLRSLARARRDFETILGAKARLDESVSRMNAITDGVVGAVFSTDFDGNVLSVNSAACLMYGYGPEEMRGLNVRTLVHESFHAPFDGMIAAGRAKGVGFRPVPAECLCVRKDGTPFEVEVRLSTLTIGTVPAYVAIIHDVSNRKAMERAVRTNEVRYRATFDRAPVGILHASLDGRFVDANLAACMAFGYAKEEMLAIGYREILAPEDLETCMVRLKEIATRTASFEDHEAHRFFRKDRSVMWALYSVCLIRGEGGTPDYFLTMMQDITELKRVDQIKGEFISTVSHELRTPLTSIRGSLGLLLGGMAGTLPRAARDLAVIADKNCGRLIRLVNDILDTEKLDSGRMRFRVHVTDLRGLVERAIESMEGFALAGRVPLRLSVPNGPIPAQVDDERFIQVLVNLISNAVKFSPPDTPVEIAVSRSDDATARIDIRDRGPGIAADFRGHIFGRFSQADNSDARRMGGSGLGLAIAKGIVERLGGEIGFHTAAGQGTTFFVTLPLCRDEASDSIAPASMEAC